MKINLILIFIFICNSSICQIPLIFHINTKSDIKKGNVLQIDEELKIGTYILKYVKIYNEKNQLISDERYNSEGKFLSKYEYSYDSISGKKTSSKQVFAKEKKISVNINRYEYDIRGFISAIKTYDDNDKLLSHTVVTCDALGNPVKLDNYLFNIISKTEIAKYDYSKNRATYEVYNSDESLIHSGFFILDITKEKDFAEEGYEYNEMGHLIKTPTGFNEIKYDQYGNWTLIKRYNTEGDKPIISQQQSRKIQYFN